MSNISLDAFWWQGSCTWYYVCYDMKLNFVIMLPLCFIILFPMFFSASLIYIKIYNSVLCQSIKQVAALKSQLQLMSHAMYSSIPFHGVLLATKILSNSDIEALWREEIKVIFSLLTLFSAFSFRSWLWI